MIAASTFSEFALSFWGIILTPALTVAAVAFLSKVLLKFWFDKEIESFKSQLSREANRERIWFGKLHENRADKIAKIYELLIEIDKSANNAKYAPVTETRSTNKSPDELLACLERANQEFQQSRLYFPVQLCSDLDKFFCKIWAFGVTASTGTKISEREINRKENIMNSLKTEYSKTLKPALEKLEENFRRLLEGDDS